MAGWLANKTPENVRQWLAVPDTCGVVAETADGTIVGFAMLLGPGLVALCYLVPDVRFTGTGRAMLAALEAEARRRGVKALRLESSRTAHAFYLRNGFLDAGAAVKGSLGIEGLPMKKVLVDG